MSSTWYFHQQAEFSGPLQPQTGDLEINLYPYIGNFDIIPLHNLIPIYTENPTNDLMLFRFTVQIDICKCELYDKISNDPSSDSITRKTNTIGKRSGRISTSMGEQTERKRCKGLTAPKPSGSTYSYFPSHINAEKASLFPSSVCCCLCW